MAGRPTWPRFSDNKGYRSSRDPVTARNSTSRTRSLDVALGLSACDQSLTGPGRVISLAPPSRQTSVAGPWAPCCSKALSLPHSDRRSRHLVSTARIIMGSVPRGPGGQMPGCNYACQTASFLTWPAPCLGHPEQLGSPMLQSMLDSKKTVTRWAEGLMMQLTNPFACPEVVTRTHLHQPQAEVTERRGADPEPRLQRERPHQPLPEQACRMASPLPQSWPPK